MWEKQIYCLTLAKNHLFDLPSIVLTFVRQARQAKRCEQIEWVTFLVYYMAEKEYFLSCTHTYRKENLFVLSVSHGV